MQSVYFVHIALTGYTNVAQDLINLLASSQEVAKIDELIDALNQQSSGGRVLNGQVSTNAKEAEGTQVTFDKDNPVPTYHESEDVPIEK